MYRCVIMKREKTYYRLKTNELSNRHVRQRYGEQSIIKVTERSNMRPTAKKSVGGRLIQWKDVSWLPDLQAKHSHPISPLCPHARGMQVYHSQPHKGQRQPNHRSLPGARKHLRRSQQSRSGATSLAPWTSKQPRRGNLLSCLGCTLRGIHWPQGAH